jgi:hypothetical protein
MQELMLVHVTVPGAKLLKALIYLYRITKKEAHRQGRVIPKAATRKGLLPAS